MEKTSVDNVYMYLADL